MHLNLFTLYFLVHISAEELVLIVEISLAPPPLEYAFYISLDQVNA
jgi:hypothetical protein